MAEEPELKDLIIIKRRLNSELEMPKGGVWKIAFADFMTAMMCFFLVMWLINSASEDTRKAVASYFNPVRLAELNRKGLADPHIPPENQPAEGEQTKEESTPGNAAPAEPHGDIPRDALFSDPYKVLAEIAQTGGAPAVAGQGAGAGATAGGGPAAGGVFRDLFDPEFRQSLGEAPKTEARVETQGALGEDPPPDKPVVSSPEADGQAPEASPSVATSTPPNASSGTPTTLPSLRPAEAENSGGSGDRSELAAELSEAVRQETGGSRSPRVNVEQTGEGVMISLTDDVDFGMFAIGSAEPQPEMVRIMERIASILKTRSGAITIRGHTDARPFRSANYDNWRLSTDRAQMAYYMLVRGGLDEKRVEAIEGYADRKLKTPGDPEAAQNRRIEILLREAST